MNTESLESEHLQFLPPPERPNIPSRELHVWLATLGKAESGRALRQVLALYLEEKPEEIEFGEDEHGKPRLAVEPERLAFNLSHSGGLTLIGVCRDREVGVDVEEVRPRRNLLALTERALDPDAAAAVRSAPSTERVRVFHEQWVRREARLKCLGIGLRRQPAEPATPIAVTGLQVGDGYAAAIAVTGDLPPLRAWTLDRPLPGTADGVS
jgi:4'-phosphopantetheinyl transferase